MDVKLTNKQREMLSELEGRYRFTYDDIDSILDALDDFALDLLDKNQEYLPEIALEYQHLYDDILTYNTKSDYSPIFK